MFVGCLTSRQQASVSQGRVCTDNLTCCHTEIEVADPTFYLTQSQYTDTGPTSPSADPITPGAWQGSQWSANFEVTGMTRPRKNPGAKRDSNPGSSALEADALPLGQRGRWTRGKVLLQRVQRYIYDCSGISWAWPRLNSRIFTSVLVPVAECEHGATTVNVGVCLFVSLFVCSWLVLHYHVIIFIACLIIFPVLFRTPAIRSW